MRPCAGLMGAAWLFWGWQTGHPVLGALAAATVEAVRHRPLRWSLDADDYERIWDLSGIAVLATAILLFSRRNIDARFAFVQWIPLIYLPMLAAQWFGPQPRLEYATFTWFVRRRVRERARPDTGIDITWPCWGLCLLGASAGGRPGFYAGAAGLVGCALAQVRPRRGAMLAILSATVYLAVVAAGQVAHTGLREIQRRIEGVMTEWTAGLMESDSLLCRTSIGRVGDLRLSNRVLMRVRVASGDAPDRLREGVYRSYRLGTWGGADARTRSAQDDGDGRWVLATNGPASSSMWIEARIGGGSAPIPVPRGTLAIDSLPADLLTVCRFGSVRAEGAPSFAAYRVEAGRGDGVRAGPETGDFGPIPTEERAAVREVVDGLGVRGRHADEVVQSVAAHLARGYRYTTRLQSPADGTGRDLTPIAHFLRTSRAGHCEYFATATVLLLREAGVPARYVTGFALSESHRRGEFIVRARHAHAWCMVHRDGEWVDFDTTPPDWIGAGADDDAGWAALGEFWARMAFDLAAWWNTLRQDLRWMAGILVALMLWLGRRLLFRRRAAVPPPQEASTRAAEETGPTSPWAAVETRLTTIGLGRAPAETPMRWLDRVAPLSPMPVDALRAVAPLAYRAVYDPNGLPPTERERLTAALDVWLRGSKG